MPTGGRRWSLWALQMWPWSAPPMDRGWTLPSVRRGLSGVFATRHGLGSDARGNRVCAHHLG